MCGLTGGWTHRRFRELRESLQHMTDALVHRGPDDSGLWLDPDAGIAFGHRRLSIVDLSPAGRQPMVSSSGRWVIVFNGEIYNHLEMRKALDAGRCAPAWRGRSDTESLLAAVEAWGVPGLLERSSGMFVFALWDRESRTLWLARDRLGEKPLYYGWNRGVFLFGSELKALRAFPGFDAPVDRQALALYLRHNAVPAPFSIHAGIQKLLPGHWLRIGPHELESKQLPEPVAYWSAGERARAGQADPFTGSEADATDALEHLLRDAIRGQMVSDVPLGAFLSGGVDSSLVVALMQEQSSQPVRTFSVGFDEAAYNEAEHAAAVARHLGTGHTELYITPEDAIAVIARLPQIYDEPFADPSQIPTLLVAELARRHVTVALSGDGGDEFFGGYSRYPLAAQTWGRLQTIPAGLRRAASSAITALSAAGWDKLYRMASPFAPTNWRRRLSGDMMHKIAGLLPTSSYPLFYRELITHWQPETLLPNVVEPLRYGPDRGEDFPRLIECMMLEDTCHYLPDDLLVKIDRAAMSCSLETRAPLLDHRVFEFAWRLPLGFRMRGATGKHLLRQVLYRHVPEVLIDRPKMGFGVPIGAWLRGPLRDWAADLLDSARLNDDKYFNSELIAQKWREHQSGARDWQYHLWAILMFQAWLVCNKHDA